MCTDPYTMSLCAPRATTLEQGIKRATRLVIIFEELVQEVHAFLSDQVRVLCIGKLVPGAPGMPPHLVLQLGVQLYPVLAQVVEQLICAQDLQAQQFSNRGGSSVALLLRY